ncbi:MAG TPA: 30S ribosomal protein S8 [Chitinophagales bacterium]|nr:30S ribosomal protein S8 [Chitinophagales bacterium]
MTDPIADYLTRIRNAAMAHHRIVEVPASKLKKRITEILYEQGYIEKYKFEEEPGKQGVIKVALKYDANNESVIKDISRVSTPGIRRYVSVEEMPRVINGLGIAIISTSKGVMTDKQAKQNNVGGEVLCQVY